MYNKKVIEKINKLKGKKNAIILAHNYQVPEIQDIADFIGDSLELARKASGIKDKDIIVFCGVDFMAEMAAILNPDKIVLVPSPTARCPMAAQLPADRLIEYKNKYPDAGVVVYVNTLAETKAEADIVCTSANAIKVVNSLPQKTVLFGPDANLARWVAINVPEKKIIPVPQDGGCYVHEKITLEDVEKSRRDHPFAELMVHPESPPEIQDTADFVLSTGQMIKHAGQSNSKEFIVGTERDMTYRLQKLYTEKRFYPINEERICVQMKKNTMEGIYLALKNMENKVSVKPETVDKAKKAIERMLEIK